MSNQPEEEQKPNYYHGPERDLETVSRTIGTIRDHSGTAGDQANRCVPGSGRTGTTTYKGGPGSVPWSRTQPGPDPWRPLGDALGGAIGQIEAAYGETLNPKVEEKVP